jgi:hypothetical protein
MLAVYLQQNFRSGNWEENTATETTSFICTRERLFQSEAQNSINHLRYSEK